MSSIPSIVGSKLSLLDKQLLVGCAFAAVFNYASIPASLGNNYNLDPLILKGIQAASGMFVGINLAGLFGGEKETLAELWNAWFGAGPPSHSKAYWKTTTAAAVTGMLAAMIVPDQPIIQAAVVFIVPYKRDAGAWW